MKTYINTVVSAVLFLGLCACKEEEIRKAPLTCVETAETLYAKDFGAYPNDNLNDFGAIASALKAIELRGGKVRLVFEKGVYNIKDTYSKDVEKMLFTLKNVSDVEIDANGATFIIENPAYGLLDIQKSQRVIVKNMTIDYNPIPWTESTVEKIDEAKNMLTVKVRKGFPSLEEKMFSAENVSNWAYQLHHSIPGRLKEDSARHNGIKAVKKISDDTFEVTMGSKITAKNYFYEVGDRLGMLARRSNKISLFLAQYSDDVTYMDITAYATPSFFYKSLHSNFMNFLRCKGLIKDGRWRGGDADFVHLQNNKNGPWIEGCVVEGIADDSLVFYTRPFYVTNVSQDGKTLTINRAIWPRGSEALIEGDIFVGAPLLFINPISGGVIARLEVASFNEKDSTITLNGDVAIPAELIGSDSSKVQVFNEAFSKNFVVKNNILRNSRRFGLYWKGSNGLIANNHFEGLSSDAITLHNEASAPNGPFCSDVVIMNNTIKDCGFDSAYNNEPYGASISVYSRPSVGGKVSEAVGCHKNILIDGNSVEGWNNNAIQVMNAENVVITKNKIGAPAQYCEEKNRDNKIVTRYSENVIVK